MYRKGIRSALKNMRSSSPGLGEFVAILKRNSIPDNQRSGLEI